MAIDSTTGARRSMPKKFWLVGGITVIGLGIGALWLPSRSQTPHVAELLPAKETVGFVAVESPEKWLAAFDRAANALSDEEKRDLAPLLSAESRAAVLGFNPAEAAGWQKAGVDPERGLAVALDARGATGAVPNAFAWVADGPPKSPKADLLKWQTTENWSVAALSDATTAPAWQAPTGPRLSGDPVLRAAFADLPTGPRTALYAHADGVYATLKPQFTDKKLAALEHVTQRVRGLALVVAPERTAGRVVLSAEGVESLRLIFGAEAPKVPFSRFLPQSGVGALRVSFNLHEIFDGLMTWLPPEWMEARLGLASSRLGLLAMTGVDWSQLERGLAGQAVLAVDLSAPPTPDTPVQWLGLFSVRDGAITDAALQHFAQSATQRGKRVQNVQVGGLAGWVSQDPPVVVVRDKDTLLVAPNVAGAERALHRPQPLETTPELDGDVVLGLVFRPTTAKATPTPSGWLASLAQLEPMTAALRRDPRGLRLEASLFPLSSVLRVAGWFLRLRSDGYAR